MIKWYQKWSGIWILKKYAFYSFISGYVTIYACMIFELIKTKKMKFYSTVTICIDEKNQTLKIEEYLSYLVNMYTYVWFNAFVLIWPQIRKTAGKCMPVLFCVHEIVEHGHAILDLSIPFAFVFKRWHIPGRSIKATFVDWPQCTSV